MPVDDNEQNGSEGEDHLREIALAIKKAQKLASAGRHKFLTYLLDMASLEVNGLRAKSKK